MRAQCIVPGQDLVKRQVHRDRRRARDRGPQEAAQVRAEIQDAERVLRQLHRAPGIKRGVDSLGVHGGEFLDLLRRMHFEHAGRVALVFRINPARMARPGLLRLLPRNQLPLHRYAQRGAHLERRAGDMPRDQRFLRCDTQAARCEGRARIGAPRVTRRREAVRFNKRPLVAEAFHLLNALLEDGGFKGRAGARRRDNGVAVHDLRLEKRRLIDDVIAVDVVARGFNGHDVRARAKKRGGVVFVDAEEPVRRARRTVAQELAVNKYPVIGCAGEADGDRSVSRMLKHRAKTHEEVHLGLAALGPDRSGRGKSRLPGRVEDQT